MADDTLTISGTFVYPISPGGPEVEELIGSPNVTATSAAASLDYAESIGNVAVLAPAGVLAVNFGTLTSADYVYIGTDQEVDVEFDGGGTVHTVAAGGFLILMKAGVSAIQITCGVVAAKVKYLLLGD
jgi:hypothetical protein